MPDWSHCLESSSISTDIIKDVVKEAKTEMNTTTTNLGVTVQ